MPLKTTTDDVMKLARGDVTELFTYEEWTCARYLWVGTGQRLGPIVSLYQADAGVLEEPGIAAVREMLGRASESLLGRELNSNMSHGGAAGLELFELVKKTWKLPYRHVTDSSDTVKVGTKRLAAHGEPSAPRIPALGDIAAFRSAYEKLTRLVAAEAGNLSFEAIGKRYLQERR